jgi:hypothetical protein
VNVSAGTNVTDRERHPLYLGQRGHEAHAAWPV